MIFDLGRREVEVFGSSAGSIPDLEVLRPTGRRRSTNGRVRGFSLVEFSPGFVQCSKI